MCDCATETTVFIGDGRLLPVANQLSSSVTQKSGSLCAMMAWVGVIKTSSWMLNSVPWAVKYWANFSFGVDFGSSVSGVSKLISVQVGALENISGVSSSVMSKSVGIGRSRSFSVCAGASGVDVSFCVCVAVVFARLYAAKRSRLRLARANMCRISSGTSADSSGVSGLSVSGVGVSAVCGAGDDFVFGNGIVIRG